MIPLLGDDLTLKWSNLDPGPGILKYMSENTCWHKKEQTLPIHPHLLTHLGTLPAPFDQDSYISPEMAAPAPVDGGESFHSNFWTSWLGED